MRGTCSASTSFIPALVLEKTPEAACAAAIDLLRERPGSTFAIRARRRDKGWRLTSHELATVVGKAVQDELGLGVDLTNPDLEVHLEVDKQRAVRVLGADSRPRRAARGRLGARACASSPAASTRRSPPTGR